jgi:retron-type reverse transcriptase
MLSARTGDKLRAISEVARKGRRVKDLRRLMNHPDIWMQAYLNIQGNKGALTRGTTSTTMDGYSPERAANLVELIRERRYKPNPVRRVNIPTKVAGKMRPLGIPSADDKQVQEVVRMILERIYEPLFKDSSHGFSPKRSCHTALRSMQKGWTGTKWFIDIDIKGYFNNIDHEILMKLLEKRIEDSQFLDLIRDMLKAGYVEDWQYHKTYSGTPQGGIVSPILANVYGRLFGRKGTVASMLPWVDGNPRPHSGMHRGQAQGAWSASRRQRDLCVGRRPARGRRVGENQKGKPVIGEDET